MCSRREEANANCPSREAESSGLAGEGLSSSALAARRAQRNATASCVRAIMTAAADVGARAARLTGRRLCSPLSARNQRDQRRSRLCNDGAAADAGGRPGRAGGVRRLRNGPALAVSLAAGCRLQAGWLAAGLERNKNGASA